MSRDIASLPVARHWRDIPQKVKPRAMSREGRRRLALRALRAAAGAAVLGGVGWAAWQVSAALRGDARDLPAGMQGEPVRQIRLETDGVLDQAWLARTLALPKAATLPSLDLEALRARVLAGGQVQAVALVRSFPSTLVARVSERTPVARLMAQGSPAAWLVARDGVVYQGAGYDPAMVASLPWLDGVSLRRSGPGFAPIEGVETAAELLARAKLEAAPIYQSWRVVSLARLASDGEIEVRDAAGLRVVFGAQEDFFRQLGRLDFMLDWARAHPDQPVRLINLALGPQVPVSIEAAPVPAPASGAHPAAPSRPAPPPSARSSLFSIPVRTSP